jgi:predicted transcriptional regulator
MTAEEALADAKALREQAEALTSQARHAMRDAVIGAAEAGMGARAISRHAGVSHTAVANILRGDMTA